MDSINVRNIQLAKANAMRKHRQLRKIASFFRVLEICVVLALVSMFSIQLPIPFKNSSEYFKGLTVTLVSPRFVFILGNAIVIALFAKSGQFSGQDSVGKTSRSDLYEEFVERNREKQSTCLNQKTILHTVSSSEIKNYKRSLSDSFKHPHVDKPFRELRRSLTEKCKGSNDSGDGWVNISYPEDNMSNEEFKNKIEAFIARQKRFRRYEENHVE